MVVVRNLRFGVGCQVFAGDSGSLVRVLLGRLRPRRRRTYARSDHEISCVGYTLYGHARRAYASSKVVFFFFMAIRQKPTKKKKKTYDEFCQDAHGSKYTYIIRASQCSALCTRAVLHKQSCKRNMDRTVIRATLTRYIYIYMYTYTLARINSVYRVCSGLSFFFFFGAFVRLCRRNRLRAKTNARPT